MNKYRNNILDLEEIDDSRINKIIERYFDTVDKNIKMNFDINEYHIASVLMAIVENFDNLENKDSWMININLIMKKIKELVEQDYFDFNLGIIGGLAEIDMAIYNVTKKVGAYFKFSEKIHEELLNRTKIYISYCISNLENITIQHYDLIFGLSGIGESILYRNVLSKEDVDVLKDILYYLSILGWKITDNSISLPRFYIKSKNQMREDEKKDFPNGNLNFGLAHGMIGPMLIMAKSYSRGIVVHNQLNTIYSIYEQYKEFMSEKKGVMYWPTQLSVEKFVHKEKIDDYRIRRASWCYGTAGISRALYLSGKYINDNNMKELGRISLNNLAKLEFKEYSLISPIICHGYSGLLNILLLMFKEEKEEHYLEVIKVLIEKILDCYIEDSKYGFISQDEMVEANGEVSIVKSESLDVLEGTTGIILTLMALYKEKVISQEQLLLV